MNAQGTEAEVGLDLELEFGYARLSVLINMHVELNLV